MNLCPNFGRSLWRPLFSWLALTILCTIFYLGKNPDIISRRSSGAFSALYGYAIDPALQVPCVTRDFPATNPVAEAIKFSLKNSVLFNVAETGATRRTLGCLYGLETSDQTSDPTVPLSVSMVSGIQTVLSGLCIFLFLLAIRNLLRLK